MYKGRYKYLICVLLCLFTMTLQARNEINETTNVKGKVRKMPPPS